MVLSPEKLTKDHDLSQFDCGNESLSSWLKKFALQNQLANHAKTNVITETESNVVIGYYSYNVISVDHVDSTPERITKGLAKHPVPVFLIARLAIDRRFHGQKLGERLLLNALRYASAVSEEIPIRAVIVDALDDQAKSFYTKFDFEAFPPDSLRMWLLLKDLLKTLR